MGQRIKMVQSPAAGSCWLSMLIEAMEEAARTDLPELGLRAPVPTGLSLQLALPASTFPVGASRFSLLN